MAKDPAILWYWSDWNSGTATFTRFLKGCYIDLLHAQFNSGPLSLEEIKVVLGSDFGQSWPALSKKFKSENGLFFNERLELEKAKRKAFSESRRKNRLKKESLEEDMNNICKTSVSHMENENENRIIEERKGGKGGRKEEQFPTHESFQHDLPDITIGSVIQLVKIMHRSDLSPPEVVELFQAFKIQNLTGKKFYANPEDVFSHFINWAKSQRYVKPDTGVPGRRSGVNKSRGIPTEDLERFVNS